MKMISIEIVSEVEVGNDKTLIGGLWTDKSGKVYSQISLGSSENLTPMPNDPHICLPVADIPKLIELLEVVKWYEGSRPFRENIYVR